MTFTCYFFVSLSAGVDVDVDFFCVIFISHFCCCCFLSLSLHWMEQIELWLNLHRIISTLTPKRTRSDKGKMCAIQHSLTTHTHSYAKKNEGSARIISHGKSSDDTLKNIISRQGNHSPYSEEKKATYEHLSLWLRCVKTGCLYRRGPMYIYIAHTIRV